MNLDEFIIKLQQEYKLIVGNEYDEFEIEVVTDSDEYIICNGTTFIGGIEGTLACDVLGNIAYDTVESIGNDLFKFLKECGELIKSVEFI